MRAAKINAEEMVNMATVSVGDDQTDTSNKNTAIRKFAQITPEKVTCSFGFVL